MSFSFRLLRKKRISDNELLERLYTNARSPFGNSSIVEETLENTIDELRPRNIPTQSESLSNMSIGPPGNISLQSDKNKSDSIGEFNFIYFTSYRLKINYQLFFLRVIFFMILRFVSWARWICGKLVDFSVRGESR